MGEQTGISWCDHTFNGIKGCQRHSPGCENCYAELLSTRNPGVLGTWGPAPKGKRVTAAEHTWGDPVRWARKAARDGVRRKVFAFSLADVFEEWSGPILQPESKGRGGELLYVDAETPGGPWIPESQCHAPDYRPVTFDDVRDRLHALISLTPSLDWLLLTKRPEAAVEYYHGIRRYDAVKAHADQYWRVRFPGLAATMVDHPALQKNRWPGVTAESQKWADKRVPVLLEIPGVNHWVSYEPALGPVDFSRWLPCPRGGPETCGNQGPTCCQCDGRRETNSGLAWIVAGGESGSKARRFDLTWGSSVRDQCKNTGTAFFMKQVGDHPVEWKLFGAQPGSIPTSAIDAHLAAGGSEPDDELIRLEFRARHGADPSEWPWDLQVQEFPEPAMKT